ncbi:MAG: C25 family cysteine peptidase, partial [Candidatus Thermoplasmatota archaeon]|nr:C25 family cysteine peptidase [Candidatus Thermoplasmatota archaeon]
EYVNEMSIEINYIPPEKPLLDNDAYDLLIVSPSEFSNALQPLVEHKESYGVKTMLVSLDEIYNGNYFTVQGRDGAEKIKYFIKDSIEEWGIKYVMLVGDIEKMPIRYIWFIYRNGIKFYWRDMPTDLYYADIYDSDGKFSSWDSNNNGKYGEQYVDGGGTNDDMDMYADVYVGRLACQNNFAVKTIVDKLVSYEGKAFGEDWFKRLILIGGDTFPGWGVVEGEFMNQVVADEMPGFESIKIWYSLGNLRALSIEMAMEKGAGFVHFSGHGFPWGWGTHPIDGTNDEWVGTYYTPYITALFNRYKLPVIFFDACSTAKLDLSLSDFEEETGIPMPNISVSLPCFAWYFVQKRGGGAIATVGSTRVAFTGVNENGPFFGAGYLVYKFFEGYKEDTTPSEMLVYAQNEYMNNVWKDRWSISEFVLLGDPSLHIGGFESPLPRNKLRGFLLRGKKTPIGVL